MTSLELQLKQLQSQAPAQDLAVKRDHSSLLFDEKEAANYTREQFYDIGVSGLSHLCKFDENFDSYEPNLFDRDNMDKNRALFQKEENDALNESIERMIIRLSPYFHFFSCKQVLEWLIHRFKIHKYNSELLAVAFLPYHASNSYGRLLKILRFQRPEWNFMEQYAKEALPVPMNVLMRVCHTKTSTGSFLIPAFANHLVDAIRLLGEEYATTKLHAIFTFFASFMVHLLEDSVRIDDNLIARVMPYIGIALKSKVLPFRLAGLMSTSRLVLSKQLSEEIIANILKLTLLKCRKPWFDAALDTALLICQRQRVVSLPRKAILKMVDNRDELEFMTAMKKRIELYDVSNFLSALWKTLFDVLVERGESEEEERIKLVTFMIELLDMERLTDAIVRRFFNALLFTLAGCARDAAKATQFLRAPLRDHVRVLIIRFPKTFDVIRSEWIIRDKDILPSFMCACQIDEHEVGELSFKRTRRRRSSSSGSHMSLAIDENSEFVSEIRPDEENLIAKEEKIRNAQAQVAEERPQFRKSVLKILDMVEEKRDAETIDWALDSFSNPAYLKKQLLDELEQFFLKMIRHVSRNPKFSAKVKLKLALAQIKIDAETIGLLLSDLSNIEPTRKRTKLAVKSAEEQLAAIFAGESSKEYQRRVTFALEVINVSTVINFITLATPKTIRKIFDMIDKEQAKVMSSTTAVSEKDSSAYIQQLGLVLATKVLEKTRLPSADNFVLDCLVKLVRFAHTIMVMRSALRVLALIAPVIPNATVSQFMSLFTFMGDGVIRRDNETTLQILEETLYTLFSAILKTDNGKAIQKTKSASVELDSQRQILEIMRIFAQSLTDTPAHRRMRILRAVLSTVPRHNVWVVIIVLFEDFCVRWQSARFAGQKTDERIDDLLLELLHDLPNQDQAIIVQNVSDYLKRFESGNELDSVKKKKTQAAIPKILPNGSCDSGIVMNGGEKTDGSTTSSADTPKSESCGAKRDNAITNFVSKSQNSTGELVIFDRSKHPPNVLRHFRFVMMRFIEKSLLYLEALKNKHAERAASSKSQQ